jgi:hypothetical protein
MSSFPLLVLCVGSLALPTNKRGSYSANAPPISASIRLCFYSEIVGKRSRVMIESESAKSLTHCYSKIPPIEMTVKIKLLQ